MVVKKQIKNHNINLSSICVEPKIMGIIYIREKWD